MIALLTLLLAASPAPARADAVGPDPSNCPSGTRPTSTHAGSWCEATTCQVDAQCGDSAVCREHALCVRTEEYQPGGLRAPDEPLTKLTRHIGVQECGESPCPANSRCERVRRCVAPSLTEMFTPGAGPPGSTRVSGCSGGCAVGAPTPARAPRRVPLALYALAAAVVVLGFAAARRPR